MTTYKEFDYRENFKEITNIYQNIGWLTYLEDVESLQRAFANSLYILGAFEDDKLVGFVRCVGDGEHIVLVQDLIVDADSQQKGIGSHLFRSVWVKYEKVRMFQVVTDMFDEVDNHFYQSFGMRKLEEGQMISYFR